MSIRVQVLVSCDAPGCERATEATAELELSIGQSVTFDERGEPCFERRTPPGFRNFRFPSSATGEPSEWRVDEHRTWCPEHPAKEDPPPKS